MRQGAGEVDGVSPDPVSVVVY
ncbi:protein of unknown function (plasmid) [Caballeronia sp. S22]